MTIQSSSWWANACCFLKTAATVVYQTAIQEVYKVTWVCAHLSYYNPLSTNFPRNDKRHMFACMILKTQQVKDLVRLGEPATKPEKIVWMHVIFCRSSVKFRKIYKKLGTSLNLERAVNKVIELLKTALDSTAYLKDGTITDTSIKQLHVRMRDVHKESIPLDGDNGIHPAAVTERVADTYCQLGRWIVNQSSRTVLIRAGDFEANYRKAYEASRQLLPPT